MPRDITVTFADGSTHVYRNAPDDISPEAVTQRAQSEFNKPIKALDGGRGRPAQETTLARQTRKFASGSAQQAQKALAIAEQSFTQALDRKKIEGKSREQALARFRADPRWRTLRKTAGMPEVFTRREELREIGQARARKNQQQTGTGLNAYGSGFARSMFGIPERLRAGAEYYLGTPEGKSYAEQLQINRDQVDAEMQGNTAANIIGQVQGSLTGGGVVGAGLRKVAARGAAAASPTISRAANYLQGLLTLEKGRKVKNAAKIVGSGAGFGAAQAVGEDKDPVIGAAYGAGGAALLGSGLKLGQVLTRPVRDVLRLTRADAVISRLTGSTAAEISERAAQYRQATGSEPTIFELLPLADRNRILKQGIVGRDPIVEQASTAIRARAENLGPEMAQRAEQIVRPQRNAVTAGMRQDMVQARGGTPDPTDAALVTRAARSPTDMLELRGTEGRAIMAPHENTPVVAQLDELFPSVPSPNGQGRIATDPEVSAVIRSAAGVARQRAAGDPITAGDVTDMISTLRSDLGKGGIEGRTAQRAIDHLQDTLDTNAPEAGQAAREMSEAWAARSRMAEGMAEGGRTRLRDDVAVGTSRREAQKVRNAYDSPEGAAGRVLGQSNRIISDLGGSPDEALRATVAMSRGSTGRALRENLGPRPADWLIDAARAQDESAQALAAASTKAQSAGGGGSLDGETLVQALVGLHPSSFITTKAGAIRTLMDMTYIPESRARVMVEMLFSQNPDLARRALNAIGNSPNGAAFTQRLAGTVGQMAGGTDISADAPSEEELTVDIEGGRLPLPGEPGYEDFIEAGYQTDAAGTLIDPAAEDAGTESAPETPDVSALPYAHAVVAQLFPGIEVTDDERDPNSRLGQANPGSYHTRTQNAVDVRPIPGMTFEQFIEQIEDAGFGIIEKRDEVKNPSGHATGPHWHVVIAGQPA